jgi:hypothetical protein
MTRTFYLRHAGTFHGNDLQMGMIMHKMNKDYRMKAVGKCRISHAVCSVLDSPTFLILTLFAYQSNVSLANVPIQTRVPAHFICFPWKTRQAKRSGLSALSRLIVSPYRCVGWGCEHEDRSLFIQRVKSWEMGVHRFAFQLLAMLLFYWKKSVMGLKPFIFQELLSIFLDYAGIPLAVYIFLDGYVHSLVFLPLVHNGSLTSRLGRAVGTFEMQGSERVLWDVCACDLSRTNIIGLIAGFVAVSPS